MDAINVWLAVRSKMTNERCHAVACKYYIKKKRITSLGVLRIVGLNTVMTNFLHIVGLLKQP